MSEVSAAMGLLQLNYLDDALYKRSLITNRYRAAIENIRGINFLIDSSESISNHAYFPVLIGPDFPLTRDALYQRLKEQGIYARRYFHPLISEFPLYRGMPSANPKNLPVATMASRQVLCLPIYPDLADEDFERIILSLQSCKA